MAPGHFEQGRSDNHTYKDRVKWRSGWKNKPGLVRLTTIFFLV